MGREKVDVENALEEAQAVARSRSEELLGQATRLVELEREVETLREELERRGDPGEDPRQLALDLEREKGRLAGTVSCALCVYAQAVTSFDFFKNFLFPYEFHLRNLSKRNPFEFL